MSDHLDECQICGKLTPHGTNHTCRPMTKPELPAKPFPAVRAPAREDAGDLGKVREKLEAIEKLGAREYEGEPAWNIQAVIVKEAIALLDAAIKGEKASPGKVGERFATLRAWTHWVMKNPLDEHQLAHAKSTNDLFALLETREARIAQLEAALREAKLAIVALETTQKEEGLGLLGKLVAPAAVASVDAALKEKP